MSRITARAVFMGPRFRRRDGHVVRASMRGTAPHDMHDVHAMRSKHTMHGSSGMKSLTGSGDL